MSVEEPIIIVSGLPRSGTSLMMQMLQAGGVSVLTDADRPADVSNPRGYFEYEKIKWLATDNSWLNEARGKAVKVIAQLVPFLPRGLPYQVLIMQREIGEVIQSQTTMIQSLGKPATIAGQALGPIFERNLATVMEFVRQQPQMTSESVMFRELMGTPEPVVDRIIKLLDRPNLNRQAMIATVDMSLYRSRAGAIEK